MGPALTAASGPMGHKRHEVPGVPAVTIHHPCVLPGARKVRFRTRHYYVAALLADRHNVLFYLCKTIASRSANRSACIFSWLSLRHLGSSGHPSCARRRTKSRLVYALRGLDVIYQATVCALRGSDVIYQRPRKVYARRGVDVIY